MRAMEKASQEKARQVERGKASGEILEASGAQKAGAPWAGTRRTGAGLWPQPLKGVRRTCFGFCLWGVWD